MWKIARSNKKGEIVDENVQEVVDKMDDIIASVDPTTLKFPNPNDVLTQALGTPEHTGRVRGVGGFITPTAYFHTPKSGMKRTAKEMELTNEIILLRQHIKELEENQRNTEDTPKSEQGSCTKQVLKKAKKNEDKVDDEVIIPRVKLSTEQLEDIIKPSIKGKSCLLAKDVISNVVASGILFEDKTLGSTIHGIPLGENNVRVSIDVAIIEVALPITVRDDLKTTKQSIGSHVSWPRNLVILNEEMKVKSKKENKDKIKVGDLQMLDLPEGLNSILRHAELAMKADSSISMQLPEGLFGISCKSCVLRDDIIDFCNMKEVKTLSLVAYMAYLYSYCVDSGRAQKYIFVDSSLISVGQYTPKIRAHNLCSRLTAATKDQLVVVPYNPCGHCSLLIVNLYEDVVYHLDSLRTSSKVDIKSVTCTALAIFRVQMKVEVKQNTTHWRNVKCPLQSGTVEYGYYVMRYMRDIIIKDITIITESVDTRRSYSKIELDEVRVEWANFVGRNY